MENVVKNFDLVKEEISNFKNANIVAVSKTFPIGHILPVKRGVSTLKRRLDDEGCLIISGSDGEPPWREDDDIEDIAVFGEWSGGSPDAEWGPAGSTDEEEDN